MEILPNQERPLFDTLGLAFDNKDPKFGKSGWSEPEIVQNMNRDELGNLGLSNEEELAIVAFLQTLTDDYQIWEGDKCVPPWSPAPFEVFPIGNLSRAMKSLCPSSQTTTD